MKRKILIVLVLAVSVTLAGCGSDTGEKNQGSELANQTDQNIKGVDVGESYMYEVKITEKNQMNLVTEHPPFQMDSSLERQNLIQRYKYLNDEDNVHYVYLISHGEIVAYHVARGKVSSVNSKLTNDVQIVRVPGCEFDEGDGAAAEGSCYKKVESPQMDGSYGTNGEAIFFFTTEGDYVEWNGQYYVSEEPQEINGDLLVGDGPEGNIPDESEVNNSSTSP